MMALGVSQTQYGLKRLRCFNCGRKSVQMGYKPTLDVSEVVNEELEDELWSDLLGDSEWMVECPICGWTDFASGRKGGSRRR